MGSLADSELAVMLAGVLRAESGALKDKAGARENIEQGRSIGISLNR